MGDAYTQLDQLVFLISSSVDYIKQEFRASGQAIPSLNDTNVHPFDTAATSQKLIDALRIVQGCLHSADDTYRAASVYFI